VSLVRIAKGVFVFSCEETAAAAGGRAEGSAIAYF